MEQPTDLRHSLRKEFQERSRKNPTYSLRAFSKFLGIDQSNLSKILNGTRNITKAQALKIGLRLGLKPSRLEQPEVKANVFSPLPDDEFSAISEWYHFAILELIKTNGFDPEVPAIAKRLGVHTELIRSALERLERLSFIRRYRGTWKLNSQANSWSNTKTTTEARRLLQRSLIEKSLAAIDTVDFAERDHGSLTVAIDINRLPEFKEKLKQVRQELGQYFQSDKNLNEVYQLTLSFFPLTKRGI